MLVECINDKNFIDPLNLIKEFPVKGEVYNVVGRNHTQGFGLGYILEELNNPLMPDGTKVGFSAKRFKPVDNIDLTELLTLEHTIFTTN